MGIQFQHIHMLFLLWTIPLFMGIYVYAGQKRRQALKQFIQADLLGKIEISVSHSRRRWKAAALLTAVALIIIGLSGPAWNPIPETIARKGRDVVFLLDVSKSMLAEDLKPNRLERAKLAILDCIDVLQGDRVGLVIFAGTAVVKCPLTLDYGFFRMMIQEISVDSISRGGTLIGDALRTTINEVFDDQVKAFKDIVLITDGEDHDSFPVEAAKAAGEKGIRIIAIGLGDETEGQRIPITNEKAEKIFLKHNGQEVWSKLDADTLRKMANATPNGKYLNVATGAIDLGDVYQNLIFTADKKHLESQTIRRYEEKFQIFLVLAVFLLLIELIVDERKKIKDSHGV